MTDEPEVPIEEAAPYDEWEAVSAEEFRQKMRLECLKLAAGGAYSGYQPDYIVERADVFYKWVVAKD